MAKPAIAAAGYEGVEGVSERGGNEAGDTYPAKEMKVLEDVDGRVGQGMVRAVWEQNGKGFRILPMNAELLGDGLTER